MLLEDVFTLQDVVKRYQSKAAEIPSGEFITTIGPIAAMQFPEQRLPNLSELDAVNRPVYINAAQGGVRTNSLGKAWLEAKGVMVATTARSRVVLRNVTNRSKSGLHRMY